MKQVAGARFSVSLVFTFSVTYLSILLYFVSITVFVPLLYWPEVQPRRFALATCIPYACSDVHFNFYTIV